MIACLFSEVVLSLVVGFMLISLPLALIIAVIKS